MALFDPSMVNDNVVYDQFFFERKRKSMYVIIISELSQTMDADLQLQVTEVIARCLIFSSRLISCNQKLFSFQLRLF